MKRPLLRQMILLMILLAVLPLCARAESPRKLTVMVYMCGSNLESGYGSASADLEEMLASGFDSEQIMLLYHMNLGYPVLDEGTRLLAPVLAKP